ncbi:hypothetical protein SmJEL517_g03279 [Synchytrium microbalum]|uniref:Uncharacterized protein n=1 Tax=Synchytrium microbalum TaxID=1806994 RepID=A0A507C7V4_9FUNG|nr:uncharacterized protein SmJEL517_g03279 [Synchytrium microbalum]TPX34076.1 hypothetical protein SmJEL517_g03279 [Synchytrium microbalum]
MQAIRTLSRLFHHASILHTSRPVPTSNFVGIRVASYPYELYVHPTLKSAKGPALSFLNTPVHGRGLNEMAVIGWVLDENHEKLSPSNVEINPIFEELLHDVLKDHVHESIAVVYGAAKQVEGYLNVNDSRVFVTYGRVADPEDLLGVVRLEGGKPIPNSYERSPTHRMVSSNGLLQLEEDMHAFLLQRLKKVGIS